jgi:hypothetical protein
MGLFGFLRGKDDRAMPEPGTPEFEAAVNGSALPGSVSMGEGGWSKQLGLDASDVQVEQGGAQTVDLRGTGARENVEEVLRDHGIDPDQEGQTVDASKVPGLQEAILGALSGSGLNIPNAGGFGGGISPPKQDPLAMVEHLAEEKEAGRISDAEFEAQKKQLLGDQP